MRTLNCYKRSYFVSSKKPSRREKVEMNQPSLSLLHFFGIKRNILIILQTENKVREVLLPLVLEKIYAFGAKGLISFLKG